MERIQLLQFGAPFVQHEYFELCKKHNISWDEFQDKLIETTNLPYHKLKEFWTDGDFVNINKEKITEVTIDNYLIIHFDPDTKEIIGIINEYYDCWTDGVNYFENII